MRRILVVLMASVAIMMAGCNVDTRPTTVSRFDRMPPRAMGRASYSGQFILYRLPEHPQQGLGEGGTFVTSVHLSAGEPVGFKSVEPGKVVAIAGEKEIALQSGVYEWVMQADSGQRDQAKTTVLVIVIVIAAVVVAGLMSYAILEMPRGQL
jgi:hypothetical protein